MASELVKKALPSAQNAKLRHGTKRIRQGTVDCVCRLLSVRLPTIAVESSSCALFSAAAALPRTNELAAANREAGDATSHHPRQNKPAYKHGHLPEPPLKPRFV